MVYLVKLNRSQSEEKTFLASNYLNAAFSGGLAKIQRFILCK